MLMWTDRFTCWPGTAFAFSTPVHEDSAEAYTLFLQTPEFLRKVIHC